MSAGATPLNPLVEKIRAAHPGAYDDMDDAELTKRVLAKYPQYSDLAGPGVPKPPNPIEQEIKSKPLQYTDQGEGPRPMPGSFEGHPENIGEYVPASVGQMASGVADIGRGDIAKGGHKVISGVGNATLPIVPFVAAAAPMATARAIGGGIIGGKVASGVTNALGGTEDQQDLAGDVGNIVGGGVGVKAPEIATSAARKILPPIQRMAANPLVREGAGLIAPRAAHALRIANRLSPAEEVTTVKAKPVAANTAEGTAEMEALQPETTQRAQQAVSEFRNVRDESEGLPEVEAAQPEAESRLRQVIATRPTPQGGPIVSKAKVGELLNQATGAKPLISNVPLRNQMDRVTPVVPKESSVIKSHSYDPNTRELTVETKAGGGYVHGDVSPEQAQSFANAESKGKAWNDIRNNSTLVAKVVNGKRVAIKPAGQRVATPEDLTPALEESVRIAKSRKK